MRSTYSPRRVTKPGCRGLSEARRFCTAARSVLDHDVTAQICRLWRRSKLSRKGSRRSETLRLSELVDFVVESSRCRGQDTFAGCLYLVDPGVSRVSCLEHRGDQSDRCLAGYQLLPAMVRAPTELSAEDIGGIGDACHAWHGEAPASNRLRTSPASGRRACPASAPRRILTRSAATLRAHTRPVRRQRARRGRWGTAGQEDGRLTAGIGGELYRPLGLQCRHDRAGRWDVLARHRIAVRARLFRFLLAPMRGTIPAGTLVAWRCSVS